MSRLPALLGEFARRHGMETPVADAEGRFHIVVDDVEVACFERVGRLCLVSRFGPVPESATAGPPWLGNLLNEGLRRMKRSQNTPALLEDGTAVLFARCAVDLSVRELEARIEEHLNSFEGYRLAVGSLRAGETVEAPGRPVRGLLRP